MKMYSVEVVFELLKSYKIKTHKESEIATNFSMKSGVYTSIRFVPFVKLLNG